MYLFDTDVITNIFKKRPSAFLLGRLAEVAPDAQHISTITISEIVYGAEKSQHRERHLHNLQTVLLPVVRVLEFDSRAAYIAGRSRAELERRGLSVAFPDLQIASIAIANELTLITGNTRHFVNIPGLKLENWLR